MGPPYADIPHIGLMRWGPAAAPLRFEPPAANPDAVRLAPPGTYTLPALNGLPILIVTAEASAFAAASPPTAAFLNACGASAELMDLADHDVRGNGHGLIYEKNSDEALAPVLAWLMQKTEAAAAVQSKAGL
jgi:hypothetical protein